VSQRAAPALIVAVVGLAGCAGSAKPYSASASVECMREHAAVLSQPSRAAERELRTGPHRERVEFAVRSGTTTGTRASGGDFQIGIYPSEDILWLHFTHSARERSRLMRGYRPRAMLERNVIVEWDDHAPSRSEQRMIGRCLLTERSTHHPRPWRAARQPTRFAAVVPRPRRLVPSDAVVVHAWPIPAGGGVPAQLAVHWQRVSLAGSPLDTSGLVLWERARSSSGWRLIHSLRFPAHLVGLLNLRVGDVNGDGHADVVLFEDMGGSACCGVYRVLAEVRRHITQLLVRRGCFDNTRVRLMHGALVMYDGVERDPRTANQIHCCWKTWLRTDLRWRGRTLVSTNTRRINPLPRAILLSRF
jgi:hypothetical protein